MRLPRQCVQIQCNGCARYVVQVISFELLIMRKISSIILLLFLCAIAAAAGAAYWLSQNHEKVEAAIVTALSQRLKTDAHIGSVHLDIWTSFPHVSLVLEDVHLMGSERANDTLLIAPRLVLECNALKLLGGQYQLQALALENAKIELYKDPRGQWNTDIWDSSGDSTATNLFAIDDLSISNSTLIVGRERITVRDAFASIQWSNDVLNAEGFGQIDAFASPYLSISEPLAWNASCRFNAQSNELILDAGDIDWLGAQFEAHATYDGNDWIASGEAQRLSLSEVLQMVNPKDTWKGLRCKGTASGSWSWEDNVFKSNWQVAQSNWDVPFKGNDPFLLNLDAQGSIWLKYARGMWRADLPTLEFTAAGLHWKGGISDFLSDKGTFNAKGAGEVDWETWGEMPEPLQWVGLQPNQGKVTWDGTISALGANTWTATGEWDAINWAGEYNATPWKFNGSGSIRDEELASKDFNATWGETGIMGAVSVPNPWTQMKQGTSQMTLDLHLDHWTYATEEGDSPAMDLNALNMPQGADWTIQSEIDHLQYELLALENVQIKGKITPEKWTVQSFSANALQGTLSGDASIEFQSPDEAMVIVHPTLEGCDLNELFFAFEDFDQKTLRAEHLTGVFGASGSVKFKWINDLSWQPQTLDVLGKATIAGGKLKNLEAFDDIADFLAENRMMAPLVDPEDLRKRLKFVEFDNLESAVYITKESVQLPQIDIRSTAMNISLAGTYGFDESLDYTLGFAMRDLRGGRIDEFGEIEDDGLGQQFFIAMDGSIDSPQYSWDRDAQKNHRKENIQREKELLKTLFRRSSN